jgi:hypothetical protein
VHFTWLLSTNSTVVDDAIRFVNERAKNEIGRRNKNKEAIIAKGPEESVQEISSIKYELSAGRTKYSPKREDMYAKLLQRDMNWLTNDMIWSNESETASE